MAIFKCCVVGCNSTSSTHKLFRMPRNDGLRQLWMSMLVPINSCLVSLKKKQLLKNHVCKRHFDRTRFDQTGNRVPYSYPCLFTEKEMVHGVPLSPKGYNVRREHNYCANRHHDNESEFIVLNGELESAYCRRRASDAEQSAWSYNMTAECKSVKEEPEWGEAAVAEGLYTDHDVKEELVIGPAVIQQQDIAFSMQYVLPVKEENLHKPKPAGGADVAPECSPTCPGDAACCNTSIEQQYGLRRCFVRLQRLSIIQDLQISNPFHNSCDRILNHSLAPCKLKPVHCGVENSGARAVLESSQLHPREHWHKPKLYSCDMCPKQFTFRSELTKHRQTHMSEKLYSCNICNKRFRQKSTLKTHLRVHTGEKPYKCYICFQRFTKISYLTNHSHIHTGEKLHKCDICNKLFRQKSTFNTHLRVHTGEKPHKCDICNKRFAEKSNLTSHSRLHTGEKPHKCDICNKRFTKKSTLTTHSRIHTGEKPYKCDICNKWFIQQSSLNSHSRIHTGEKSHKCDICNKRFIKKSNLTTHLRIHTGEKPYKCDIYNKRFIRKFTLTTHSHIHTGEKLLKCDICNKRFTNKSTLTIHSRIHTGKKPHS